MKRLVVASMVTAVSWVAVSTAVGAAPEDRWEPVADECVVAMNAVPFGAAVPGSGQDPAGTRYRNVSVWMVPDVRCSALDVVSNWSWDVLAAVKQRIPEGEGSSIYDQHGEIVSSRASAVPLTRCGSNADLTSSSGKPYYEIWWQHMRPHPASGFFDVSLSSDCSSATTTVKTSSGGPAFAPGDCSIVLTSPYERPGPEAGTVTAVIRVATSDTCDGPLTVAGATVDATIGTPGSSAYARVLRCDGTQNESVVVATRESARTGTGGVVSERFDLAVDSGCHPVIVNREILMWRIGGRVDCRTELATLTSARSVDDIVCASDFSDRDGDALRLYRAFFGREPDVAGAKYWIAQSGNGATADDLAYGFAESDEFVDTYGALDDEAFLTLLYRNMLARTPDPAGLDYWRNEITARGLPRHLVVRWVVANDEFIGRFPYSR